jgi:ankyrin repeat protein
MIGRGCPINQADNSGRTPLQCAILNSREVAEYLLEQESIQVSCEDDDAVRPLHLAVAANCVKLAQQLVARLDLVVDSDFAQCDRHFAAFWLCFKTPTLISIVLVYHSSTSEE